jgi:RNA polymerase sigma-70 factor (ECF subfamily)
MKEPPGNEAAFVTTRWTDVFRAGDTSGEGAETALARLCQGYWYPLYAFVRRQGHPPEEAEDLTQEFFARMIEKRWVSDADPARGRFRSFLLTALKRFLANEWHRARTQKRGGDQTFLTLDRDTAEARFQQEPADENSPDKAYDRAWALSLLAAVLDKLGEEQRNAGQTAQFEFLKPCLAGLGTEQPYDQIAARLGMTEGAIKTAVHRLRRRYRDLLRQEIAGTLEQDSEVEAEMRHLMEALAG